MARSFLADRTTRLTFGLLSGYAYIFNGLGSVLPTLRVELGVSRAAVGLHSTLFAAGLVICGLYGARLVQLFGRVTLAWLAAIGLWTGTIFFVLGQTIEITLLGIALAGTTGALIQVIVPAVLVERYPQQKTAALAAVNGVAKVAAILAQASVGCAIAINIGWRVALLIGPMVLVLFTWTHRTASLTNDQPTVSRKVARLPFAYWWQWALILFVVGVEFCLVFWSADYLHSIVGFAPGIAAIFASVFLIGMVVGRMAGGRMPDHPAVFLFALGTTAFAVSLLYTFPQRIVAPVALFIAGLGVALLYPIALGGALAAASGLHDAASSRASLASGLAVITAPFGLAALADHIGIHDSFVLVLILLIVGILQLCQIKQFHCHSIVSDKRPSRPVEELNSSTQN